VKSLEHKGEELELKLRYGVEGVAPSYVKTPMEVFRPLEEVEPTLRERIKLSTGVVPTLVQPGWPNWNPDPYKRLRMVSGPNVNGDSYSVEKGVLRLAGVSYNIPPQREELRKACERDITLWIRKYQRSSEEDNAMRFLVASSFPYLPDSLYRYSGVSLTYCDERLLQWSRLFSYGEWVSVQTGNIVVVATPPVPQVLDMTYEDLDRLQAGPGIGSEGARVKWSGTPVNVVSVAGQVIWIGLSWFYWDGPVMALEQVGLDAYIVFPETYGDDCVYDTSVGIRIHWNPWKPYDLVRHVVGEGIMIRDGMNEFRVKYVPTVEIFYDGTGKINIDCHHFRVDTYYPPGIYEMTVKGTLLRRRPAKEPVSTMTSLLNYVTVRMLPESAGPLRISPECQPIRGIQSTDIISFVQSQLVTTANVREWMLLQYGIVSTSQIQSVLMKAGITCKGQQYYNSHVLSYTIASAGKYRTRGEYLSAVPSATEGQVSKELIELDRQRQIAMDEALAARLQEEREELEYETVDLCETSVSYQDQLRYWSSPSRQSQYQHPINAIARTARTANSTAVAGELMIAQDLSTGDTVPVVCNLYPLKQSSSTSTECFEGVSVRIIAFQDGKDAFRNQVNFKYPGGLRDAYFATQATNPQRKVIVSRKTGMMQLGSTLSFREWSIDLSKHPNGARYGEWLWDLSMENVSFRGHVSKFRGRCEELRQFVGEACPYFVWDPEPAFRAN